MRRPAAWTLAILGLGLVRAGVSVVHAGAAEIPRRPNLIFILADDLGYGDLGCYGQTKIKTPNIDRLAAEGMKFTHFYAGASVCAPSRCVLMTGKHTGHCRVRGNAPLAQQARQSLAPEDVTVAALLKQGGYATALIGKWGLGMDDTPGHPLAQGFDFFFSVSLVPTLLGRSEEQKRHEYLYWEYHAGRATSQALLLDGHWKAIRNESRTAPLELYDLRADVAEAHDVASEHPRIVARAEACLKAAREDSANWPLLEPRRAATSSDGRPATPGGH